MRLIIYQNYIHIISMFVIAHFKDTSDSFVLIDKEDLKEVAEHMNIEIEKEITFEEFDKDYSFYPLVDANDLIIKAISKRGKTATHKLDSLDISCWIKLKQEYNKIQEKKSNLSRSERELVEKHYDYIKSLSDIKA